MLFSSDLLPLATNSSGLSLPYELHQPSQNQTKKNKKSISVGNRKAKIVEVNDLSCPTGFYKKNCNHGRVAR